MQNLSLFTHPHASFNNTQVKQKQEKAQEKKQIPLRSQLVWQCIPSGPGQSLKAMNFHTPTLGA